MLTREQVLDIQTYCAEHKITIGERLGELHIETSQFYRWQRKYRQEDEQGSDPGSFVQLTQGGAFVSPMMPPARTSGKSRSKNGDSQPQEQSFLTVELRTASGAAMRIQGCVVSGFGLTTFGLKTIGILPLWCQSPHPSLMCSR